MKLNAAGVGIRIKQARTAKGWTQAQLAKAVGVQRSSVVRWETGVSVPQCIPEIAQLLGQPAAWFLDKADTEVQAESQELVELRKEIRRLAKQITSDNKTGSDKARSGKSEPTKSEPTQQESSSIQLPFDSDWRDEAALVDVLRSWNSVNSETRLMVALMTSGDWSYKLKLWNLNVAVGDEMLRAIGSAHRTRHHQT